MIGSLGAAGDTATSRMLGRNAVQSLSRAIGLPLSKPDNTRAIAPISVIAISCFDDLS